MGKILERMFTMEVDEFNTIFKNKSDDALTIEDDYHRINVFNDEIVLRS